MKKAGVILLFLSFLLAGNSCHKNEPIPKANFNYSGNNGFHAPCNVIFDNTSANSFSWDWNFGDGSTSTDQNPTHTYTAAGSFVVNLKAYTESRMQWASASQTIQILDTLK
jgi:PKD repeat protein